MSAAGPKKNSKTTQVKEAMKLHDIRNSRLTVLGGIAILAACATATLADGVSSGWYAGVDSGLNMMPGIRGNGFGGGGGGETTTPGDPKIRLSAGARVGVEVGYGFNLTDKLTLGVEAESGAAWNGLSSVTAGSPGSEQQLGGNFYQIPVLGNLVASYHIGKWIPYVGVGGGLDYCSVNIYSPANSPFVGAGSDWGPAIQAKAGVRYQLTEKIDVGVGFKYLDAFSEKLGGFRASSIQSYDVGIDLAFHF
jgi:opacity protein-like surface antigen